MTPQRLAIVEAIAEFTEDNGYPPTVREVMHWLGRPSTDPVVHHLRILREHGIVSWEDGKARTLKVLKEK